MAESEELTQRGAYTHFQAENIRFSDTDMIGHVNNVAYAALLESGRTAFSQVHLYHRFMPNTLAVMARVEINYLRELHWPGRVEIGTRIVAIGRTSYATGQGVFIGETCFATGRTTLVMIDRDTRKSAVLVEAFRGALETLMK